MRRMRLVAVLLVLGAFSAAGASSAQAKTTLELSVSGSPVVVGEEAFAGGFEVDVNTSLGDVKCESSQLEDLFYAKDLTNNLPTDSIEVEYAGGFLDGEHACASESKLGKHSFVSFVGNNPLATITLGVQHGAKDGKAAFAFTAGAEVRTEFLETSSECLYRVKSLKGEVFDPKFEEFGVPFKESKVALVKAESTVDCPTKATLDIPHINLLSRSPRVAWNAEEL